MTEVFRFFNLVRYPNLLIVAATQLLCFEYLTVIEYKSGFPPPEFYFILAASVLTAAAGYIINDILDINADKINKPGKVFITQNNIKIYARIYWAINIAAVVLAALAGIWVAVSVLFLIALLYFYSKKLKHLPLAGNLAVALCSAAVTWIFYFSDIPFDDLLLMVYSSFAFITTVIREIVKDAEDLEGDKATGSRTLPLVFGVKMAKNVALSCIVALIVGTLLFVVYCFTHFKLVAFYYLVLLVIIPCTGLFFLLLWAKEKKHYSFASLYTKLLMVAGLVSMIFMK